MHLLLSSTGEWDARGKRSLVPELPPICDLQIEAGVASLQGNGAVVSDSSFSYTTFVRLPSNKWS